MRKIVMPCLGLGVVLINVAGIICVFLYPPQPYALFGLSFLPLFLIVYIEFFKKKMLLEKKQILSMVLFAFLIIFSLFYLILGLAMLIYLQEVQDQKLQVNRAFDQLMWQRSNISNTQLSVLSVGYYLGTCIFLSFYARQYYLMYWVNQIVHIFRYLKSQVKQLNETLLNHLPVITFKKQYKNQKCILCIEYYKSQEILTKLSCGHLFHRDCIRLWVIRSNACPLCRKRVIFY